MHLFDQLKKILILLFASITLTIFCISNLRAQQNDQVVYYLKLIEQHTNDILTAVSNLPNYLDKITQQTESWMKPDDTTTTATMQTSFNQLGTDITKNLTPDSQLPLITRMTADAFGVPVQALTQPKNYPAILSVLTPDLININDIVYMTLLGFPPVQKISSPSSPYNYVKYISGIRLQHAIPKKEWLGDADSQIKYLLYFATVKAIELYDGAILSQKLSETDFTNTQVQLIKQASDPKWLALVGSDDLGRILRQILLFQSQSYVLMSQLIQTEKQLLATTAMTNTVLILNNTMNESLLVAKAKGEKPKP